MVSASIGIAGAPIHATTGDELLKNADSAMYLAKSDRSGYTVYSAERDQRVFQRVSMATALRQALDQRQLEVDYQPIVQVQTGAVIGIESLVRWNHPERGRLLPDGFMRVAEQTGLVNPLTGFVLDRALKEWPLSAMPATCSLTVNVSPRSLHHSAFPGRVAELLEQYGTPPASLTLEITEHLVMSDPDSATRCMHQLHDMGVTLAIDDFGRGYSSLTYLRRLPVNELKIDRSFLIALAEGEDDVLVRSMIDLAHNLGMQVVAEGVETEGVYQQMVELGCDAVQGYHILRPVPAAELNRWIERRPPVL
jgi:EAL domain-containing protein (putative c-di-GMP-specific phosphodiesterase class I)